MQRGDSSGNKDREETIEPGENVLPRDDAQNEDRCAEGPPKSYLIAKTIAEPGLDCRCGLRFFRRTRGGFAKPFKFCRLCKLRQEMQRLKLRCNHTKKITSPTRKQMHHANQTIERKNSCGQNAC
jgi:hypothetical protein